MQTLLSTIGSAGEGYGCEIGIPHNGILDNHCGKSVGVHGVSGGYPHTEIIMDFTPVSSDEAKDKHGVDGRKQLLKNTQQKFKLQTPSRKRN